jgi:hypothetical protein
MKTRRRSIAGAVGLALVALGASVAAAAPSHAADPGPLSWELAEGETEIVGSLFGDVAVGPGHDETRTLTVSNVGEHDGTLQVSIVNAVIRAGSPADVAGLTVNGQPAASLVGNPTVVQTAPVAAGESVLVPVSLAFTDSGQSGPADAQRNFGFDVRLSLSGEFPAVEAPVVDDDQSYVPADDDATSPDGPRAETGGMLALMDDWSLLSALAFLIGGLLALVPALRRRRKRARA